MNMFGSQMMWTWSCAWPVSSSSLAGGPYSSTVSCCARTHTMSMSGTSVWPCIRAAPVRCVMVPQPMLPCLLELPWPNSALTYLILLFQIINTYTEAVQTVDPFKATGKPHTLWVAFAKFYEDNGQLDDARVILEKATKVNFKQVDDLASVWCQCGELELRHENYDEALKLLRVRM